MSDPENQDSSQLSELKQDCADLRRQSNMLLITLTIVSLTFTASLVQQARRAGKDLDALRLQVATITETIKKERPVLDVVVNRLASYGQTHSDFAAILAKYPIRQTGTNAVSPSSVLPSSPLTPR